MNKSEMNIPKEYTVISVRTLRSQPTVYVLADHALRGRVGLLSTDGGKTFKEVWKRSDEV